MVPVEALIVKPGSAVNVPPRVPVMVGVIETVDVSPTTALQSELLV
jgi:hypothetical protein